MVNKEQELNIYILSFHLCLNFDIIDIAIIIIDIAIIIIDLAILVIDVAIIFIENGQFVI